MSYFQWQTPLHWFGPTLGASVWLAISGLVLLARGHTLPGVVFLAGFLILLAMAVAGWSRRARQSAYHWWQRWLAGMWVVSLLAIVTVHVTGAYPAINLDDGSLLLLYIGGGLGVPLLMADSYWREKTAGQRGVFGAVFDIIASLF